MKTVMWLMILGVLFLDVRSAFALHERFKITNKLGVETTFTTSHITHGSELLDESANNYDDNNHILISVGSNTFYDVWCKTVARAELSNDRHTVTLINGDVILGKMISTVHTMDNKQYDLGSVTKLEFVPESLPAQTTVKQSTNKSLPITWELIIPGKSKSYIVTRPVFAMQYYSSSGYAIGGRTRVSNTSSFAIKVGKEEMKGEISDFNLVKMDKGRMVLESGNGTVTKGELILKAVDDAGDHPAIEHALNVTISEGEELYLLEDNWTLKKATK